MILKNGMILLNGKLVKKDIEISDDIIVKIEDEISAEDTIDLQGKYVSPGLIDVHVHFRSPGFEYKEDIKSGSLSAAKGGYTKVCTMPNLDPVPSSVEALRPQLELIKSDSVVKVIPYASISKDLCGEELSDFNELHNSVCAFTDDGLGVQSSKLMKEAMKTATEIGAMIVAHCEDENYIEIDNERAEYEQVARDLKLAKKIKCKYHICHISTKESVKAVKSAKNKGVNVTCEVAPHHLLLTKDDVKDNPNFKMNPPLRSCEDVEACVLGIIDGTIDMIATDHAPHSEEEKSKEFNKAPNGVVGLETAFALMYTNFVKTGKITFERLMELMVYMPAKRFGFKTGLSVGAKADIAIFDLEQEFMVEKEAFLSKGKNTPFDRNKLFGETYMTIVDGKIVYKKA